MKKPNFLGVGATKSGTSSIRHYLKQHQEIYIPDEYKEPGYFCYGGDNSSIFFRVKSEEEYFGLFDGVKEEKAYGEITPHYLTSPHAPENIKATIPKAKLIISIRNPIERAFSLYQMNLRNNNHNKDVPFINAVENDSLTQSPYFNHISRYYSLFSKEQILLVLFDDLVADPVRIAQIIFGFLEVDPTFVPDVSKVVNPGGMPRSKLLHAVLNNRTARRVGRRFIPKSAQNRLESMKNANLRKREMDTSEKKKAVDVFRDDILKTQDLIGKDLSKWLYV